MPTAAEVLQDPKFQGLPIDERRKVLTTVDSNFGSLPSSEQDRVLGYTSPSVVDKIRNYMGTGDPNTPPHLPTDADKFNFPPWLNAVATAGALTSGAQALGDIAEYGIPAGVKAVGAGLKSALAPKSTGRIAKFAQGVGNYFDEQAASKVPDALRTSAEGYDPAKAKALNKQLLKSSPGSDAGGGRSYGMPKKAPGVATSPPTTGASTPEVPSTPDTPVPAPAPSKTAQNLADKIQEHTTAKDQAIISHLKDKGVTPDQFKAMSPEEQNGVLNELNSKTGKKYRFRFDRGTQGTDAVNRLLDTWGK